MFKTCNIDTYDVIKFFRVFTIFLLIYDNEVCVSTLTCNFLAVSRLLKRRENGLCCGIGTYNNMVSYMCQFCFKMN